MSSLIKGLDAMGQWVPGDTIDIGDYKIAIPHERYERDISAQISDAGKIITLYKFARKDWHKFFGVLLELRANPNDEYLHAVRSISRDDWPDLQRNLLVLQQTNPQNSDHYMVKPIVMFHILPLLIAIKDLAVIKDENPLTAIQRAISIKPKAAPPQAPPPSPARWYPILIGLTLTTFAVALFGPPSCISQSHNQPIKNVEPKQTPPQERQSHRSTGLAADPALMRAHIAMHQHGRA